MTTEAGQNELAAPRALTSGTHTITDGHVVAHGSAKVEAHGSAKVVARGSAADEIWYHWIEGQEDLAIAALRKASDEELARFLDMLARWQKCPKPSDHDAAAALRSEAQGEEDAVRRTWELAVQRAYGCLDYCGGYRGAELKAFHSGIKTVIRALEAGLDTVDTQTAALDRIGAALRSEAQGEGWQVTEPARDIVRREMPETRATVREAIRAARRGEGGE